MRVQASIRAGVIVALGWLVLIGAGVVFEARWPHHDPRQTLAETWAPFVTLNVMAVVLAFTIVVTLIRTADRLSRLALSLVAMLTGYVVLWIVAFIGARMWPEHFSLGVNYRVRTMSAMLILSAVWFAVELIRAEDPDEIAGWRTALRRIAVWLAVAAAMAVVYWWLPIKLNERWGP